jgi:Tol biopolymer transport system component
MNNYLKTCSEYKRTIGLTILLIASILPSFLGLGADDKTDTKGLIAFVSFNWTTKKGDICLIDEEGHNMRQLTKNQGDNKAPVWSPDGKQIAFLSSRKGTYYPYVMNADGSSQQCLSPIEAIDRLNWSPSGTQIAFVGLGKSADKDKNWDWEIYVIDIDGSNLKRLTYNDVDDRAPAWSPDGKQIAFVSYIKQPSQIEIKRTPNISLQLVSAQIQTLGIWDCTLCLINPDGTNLVNLVNFRREKQNKNDIIDVCYGTDYPLEIPHWWTPDSKKIVLEFLRDCFCADCSAICSAIGIANLENKEIKPLTSRKICEGPPDLSPDGKQVLCSTTTEKGIPDKCLIDVNNQNIKYLDILLGRPSDALDMHHSKSRLEGHAFGCFDSWSLDSKKIVFESLIYTKVTSKNQCGCSGEFSSILYAIDIEKQPSLTDRCANLKKLTSRDLNIAHVMPAWSPVK